MTRMVSNTAHEHQVETAVQRLVKKLKLEVTSNKPEYEAIMESKEAFARIRQVLMAICELYQLKERLWDETISLSNTLTPEARTILDNRHQPINETIYQRMIEINYMTQYLSAEQLRDVDGYIEQLQPQLNNCVPRLKNPTHLIGGKDDYPETWYDPQRTRVSKLVERTAFDVISVTAQSWEVEPDPKRRTRAAKFA